VVERAAGLQAFLREIKRGVDSGEGRKRWKKKGNR